MRSTLPRFPVDPPTLAKALVSRPGPSPTAGLVRSARLGGHPLASLLRHAELLASGGLAGTRRRSLRIHALADKAIHRAAVNGFALLEAAPVDSWRQLQLFIRHRRDLVRKSSALACQIREHLDAALPGYAACFDKLWESNVAAWRSLGPPTPDKAARGPPLMYQYAETVVTPRERMPCAHVGSP
jgi:hypothetical protein